LTIANLIQQIVRQQTEHLQQAARLPDDVQFNFDPRREAATPQGTGKSQHRVTPAESRSPADGPTPVTGSSLAIQVQKTARRTVVSLEQGRFRARETVLATTTADGQSVAQRSSQLAQTVPAGSKYGFDLIAYAGMETYLHGGGLQDVQQALAERRPAVEVPLSSLWDQQRKFLFLLGRMHRRAAPRIREYLAGQPPVTWLLDGTLEPETPVFLGIEDAASGMLLDGWKIPSENADDIAASLAEAAGRYGTPGGVLHDLSPAMRQACDAALAGVPHRVCHFHLARDVGNDLCGKAQTALVKRLRALKIQSRLREQRKGQTQWLRNRAGTPEDELVLGRLLAGEPLPGVPFDQTLGREVLLAFHFWILDHRQDGQRRGLPFDPYSLYLHRRLVRAGEAVDRLLSHGHVARQAPPVLKNFQKLLAEYRTDDQIVSSAADYERAYAMFGRLREALSLSAETMRNLRLPYELPDGSREPLQTALHALRESLRAEVEQASADQPLAQTVLTHLDKYWDYLVPASSVGPSWERTTNKLESHWSVGKRSRRQTHGRAKLTRDFQSLPPEYLLVPNLANPCYVELLLDGDLSNLASNLSAASEGGESFSSWGRSQCNGCLGRPSRRHLRSENFLPNLIELCEDQCCEQAA